MRSTNPARGHGQGQNLRSPPSMNSNLPLLSLVFLLFTVVALPRQVMAQVGTQTESEKRESWKDIPVLAPIPHVTLQGTSKISSDDATEIRQLISKLAEVDGPWCGYGVGNSLGYSGLIFAPITET